MALLVFNGCAQNIWKDSLKTTVHLTKFKQKKKVVRAEYGRVIMYFNQLDYLKTEVAADTIVVTPKYFDDTAIAHLLKKGKVKIFRRSDSSIIETITHHLHRVGSTCDRQFEFEDGKIFFQELEIIGLMDDLYSFNVIDDSSNVKTDTTITAVNKFEYKEEFPDFSDINRIKIKDYLPVSPFTYYVYNDNNGYGELDTNQCKTAVLQNQNIFYFAECYNKYDIVSIGTTMFGGGIYFYKNDSLFTIEADYEKEIPEKELTDAILLLPPSMIPGDSITCNFGDYSKKLKFSYLKKEDIKIGTIVHHDCIKLKVIEQWPETNYLGYIWFKKNTGLIKWMRSTSRIDEMIDIFTK